MLRDDQSTHMYDLEQKLLAAHGQELWYRDHHHIDKIHWLRHANGLYCYTRGTMPMWMRQAVNAVESDRAMLVDVYVERNSWESLVQEVIGLKFIAIEKWH